MLSTASKLAVYAMRVGSTFNGMCFSLQGHGSEPCKIFTLRLSDIEQVHKDWETVCSDQPSVTLMSANCVHMHIIAGSAPWTSFMQPRIMSCPCPSSSCGLCCNSGWVLMLCQLSKAGFQGLSYHAIFAAAHFAAPGLLVMSATISLNAQNLMKLDQFAQLYESSAGAMRSFVWHKDQQAVCDCMTAVIRLAET